MQKQLFYYSLHKIYKKKNLLIISNLNAQCVENRKLYSKNKNNNLSLLNRRRTVENTKHNKSACWWHFDVCCILLWSRKWRLEESALCMQHSTTTKILYTFFLLSAAPNSIIILHDIQTQMVLTGVAEWIGHCKIMVIILHEFNHFLIGKEKLY
jgi:hypothetical protein